MKAINSLDQINWRKKPMVEACIRIAKEEKNIKKMIIFGSSVTDHCDENSDLDICLDMSTDLIGMETYNTLSRINKACDWNCDILFYDRLRGQIKKEIDQKGVIVYAS